jgi:hypothetical protein
MQVRGDLFICREAGREPAWFKPNVKEKEG